MTPSRPPVSLVVPTPLAPGIGMVAGTSVVIDAVWRLGGVRPGAADATAIVALAAGGLLAALAVLSPRLAVVIAGAFVGWAAGTVVAAPSAGDHGLDVLAVALTGALVAVILVLLLTLDRWFLVLGGALAGARLVVAGHALLAAGGLSTSALPGIAPVLGQPDAVPLAVLTLAGVLALLPVVR